MKLAILIAVIAAPILLIAQTPIKFTHFVKTNSDTATPVAFTNTVIKVTVLTLIGRKADRTDNTGTVWVGMSSDDGKQIIKVPAGETVSVNIPTSPSSRSIDLSQMYLDVETANDGVLVVYE